MFLRELGQLQPDVTNMAVDVFSRSIKEANNNGLVTSRFPRRCDMAVVSGSVNEEWTLFGGE